MSHVGKDQIDRDPVDEALEKLDVLTHENIGWTPGAVVGAREHPIV